MEEWKTYTLSDVCADIFSGGTPSSMNPEYWGGSLLWLSSGETSQRFIYETKKRITPLAVKNSSTRLAKKGSTVIATAGQGRTRGQVSYLQIDTFINQSVIALEANPQLLDPLFLYYNLDGRYEEFRLLSDGTSTRGSLSGKILKSVSISIPRLETQKKIVSILKSIDDKIELNNRINRNWEEQAKTLFKSWFVDFDPFKDDAVVDSELGLIPESLSIVHISDLPHTIESGKRPKGGIVEVIDGIPSIGAENIKGLGVYDYSKTKLVSREFASSMKKGVVNGYELLIYKDGGKPGFFIPNFSIFGEGFPFDVMTINEHVFLLDFGDKGFNAFSYFYFQTKEIMSYLNAQGGKAAIPGINRGDVEAIPIFSPQNEYVKRFGSFVLPIITAILKRCHENHLLSELRDALLPKLMSGEIAV